MPHPAVISASQIALHRDRLSQSQDLMEAPHAVRHARNPVLIFWALAVPACLFWWAAVAYGFYRLF